MTVRCKRFMRACLLPAWGLAFALGAAAEAGNFSLEYVGVYHFAAGTGSDCWGWTAPDGTEYALMGYRNGIGIVRTTPSVVLVDTVPGPMGSGGYVWRDIKTYRHYAYAVSEATGTYSGISVIDLSTLPDSVRYVGSFSTNGGTAFTSHNLSIDTVKGFAYLEGNTAEKIRIMNLANPENPQFVNAFGNSPGQIHDVYAHNDTVYVAEGSAGTWSIWDLSNKLAPQMLVRISIPSAGYVHNIWPSENRRFCVTTEETAGKTIKVWNISNYANVQLVAQYLAPSNLAHNAHWSGDFHVNSHYESGIQLMDVSDPTQPVELDRFDTYLSGEGPGFNGCWGAFPFTRNGYAYASNIDGRLWVFKIEATCPLAGVPALQSPPPGATKIQPPARLIWSDEAADSYRVQLDDDPAFASPEFDSVTTLTQADVSAVAYKTTYYWRVLATNGCGDSDWSPAGSFTTGCVVVTTGDVDESGSIDASDLIDLVNYLFKSGPAPRPVPAAGDVNCTSAVDAADLIYLVNYVFKSGPTPCDVCSLL